MLPGIVMTLLVAEPAIRGWRPAHACATRWSSRFASSSRAPAGATALLVLAFIFLYKLGDSMATALATPFYLDMGFTQVRDRPDRQECRAVAERHRRPARRPVDGEDRHQSRRCGCSALVQCVVDPGFRLARLASPARRASLLACVIGFEALGRGTGHGGVHRVHRAHHQSALHRDPVRAVHEPRGGAAHAGQRVDRLDRRAIGWFDFFLLCTVLALPGMVLLWWVAPWNDPLERK